jgi:hypothetical protein
MNGSSERPGRSTHRCFFQKSLMSGIIYVIPDNRLRIEMDGLMHL